MKPRRPHDHFRRLWILCARILEYPIAWLICAAAYGRETVTDGWPAAQPPIAVAVRLSRRSQRLDRILRAEDDDPNRYKIAKQADTTMLFYLFSDVELRHIFGRLGYDYKPDTAVRNVEYYDQRTSHGSTLNSPGALAPGWPAPFAAWSCWAHERPGHDRRGNRPSPRRP
jgi:hypothetical protein